MRSARASANDLILLFRSDGLRGVFELLCLCIRIFGEMRKRAIMATVFFPFPAAMIVILRRVFSVFTMSLHHRNLL